MSGRGRRGSPVGSILVLLGALSVVGVAFGGGFVAGRFWPDIRARLTGDRSVVATSDRAAETSGSRGGRGNETRGAAGVPALTFYQELTAPLAAPEAAPAKPEGAKTERAKPESTKTDNAKGDPPRDDVPRAGVPASSRPPGATEESDARTGNATRSETYTVQVAAYKGRAQADALRDKLATRGLAADVSHVETPAGMLYRVRVGTYATRAEAVEAAARIAADPRVGTFVATR